MQNVLVVQGQRDQIEHKCNSENFCLHQRTGCHRRSTSHQGNSKFYDNSFFVWVVSLNYQSLSCEGPLELHGNRQISHSAERQAQRP